MKIAVTTNFWKNSEGGGIKTFLVNLVNALKDRNIDVDVLFREGTDENQFFGGKNKVMYSLNCYRQLRNIRPDVVHSQGAWFCLLPGAIYKQLHGCTLIHTFHSEPYKKLSLPSKIFFQMLLNKCNCVTFVSKRLQDRVIEVDHFKFQRTEITYPGIRPGEVTEKDIEMFQERFGIKKDAVILLAQGMTAHPLKANGLKLLIEAVRLLRETHPNIVLIATRKGIYSQELMSFTREIGMDDNVIFTGDLENPFIPLKLCDLYTHITFGDGLPMALLEAMAMGKPIVATSVGGIPEAITDGMNGLLVSTEVDEIVQKIEYLLRNREIAQDLGSHAKTTVEEKFTWDQAAEKFNKCYFNQCDRSLK